MEFVQLDTGGFWKPKANGQSHSDTWHNHRAKSAIENINVKILWDFNAYVDKFIKYRRSDIIMANETLKECMIIDIFVSGDVRTDSKENEKFGKYQNLAREISRLCYEKTKMISAVVGKVVKPENNALI